MIDIKEICKLAKNASYQLAGYSSDLKNAMLDAICDALKNQKVIDDLLDANKIDIKLAKESGKNDTFVDRLTLTMSRINSMIEGLEQVKALADPVGEVVEHYTLDNGLDMKRVRAPLGVIGIIYEARPNVTIDAAALCLKSGNAVVLRGSKDALNSNRVLYLAMSNAIKSLGLNSNVVAFIDDPSRDASKVMLEQEDFIDVIIPRGGEGLKKFVLENAKMPVIASAGGNCHIFVDKTADFEKAINIIINAKTQRPSTCNAVEHILCHKDIAKQFLPLLYKALTDNKVEVFGDQKSKEIVENIKFATEKDFETEFLDFKITIQIVDEIVQAVDIINKNGTKHSEAILTSDKKNIDYFFKYVDAAAVYSNASTRFTDGFQFGLGAEMGISTQKLHARGPIALKELTSIKYTITGKGQVRK